MDAAAVVDAGRVMDGGHTDAGMVTVDGGGAIDAGGEQDAGGETDGGPADAGTVPACTPGGSGATHFYAINVLDIGRQVAGMPGVVPGFNLDGRVSDGTDATSCFQQDYTAPAPDGFMGVDNQLGVVLAALESVSGGDLAAGLADAIAAGDLLILVEVSDVDDLVNDDCVHVSIYYGLLPGGVDAPMVDVDDRLLPGQTFDIDSSSLDAGGAPLYLLDNGRIVAGRLRAGPGPFEVRAPTDGAPLVIALDDARSRFDITADAMGAGVVGGSGPVSDLTTAFAAAFGVDPTVSGALLEGAADLDVNAMDECERISAAFVFSGVAAARGIIR